MTIVPPATHRSRLPMRVVRPNVRRFHSVVPILAIGYGVPSSKVLHHWEFSQFTPGVFEEEVFGLEIADNLLRGEDQFHPFPCLIGLRCMIPIPIFTYLRHGERLARGGCPDDIWFPWYARYIEVPYVANIIYSLKRLYIG